MIIDTKERTLIKYLGHKSHSCLHLIVANTTTASLFPPLRAMEGKRSCWAMVGQLCHRSLLAQTHANMIHYAGFIQTNCLFELV